MAQQDKGKEAPSHPPSPPTDTGEAPPSTDAAEAPRQDGVWDRLVGFLTNTKNAVLTLGALAAAVTAILVLINSPSPPALKVDFDRLKVDDRMSLAEFDAIAESQPVKLAGLPSQPMAFLASYQLARPMSPASARSTPSTAEVVYLGRRGVPGTSTLTTTETSTEVKVTSTTEDTSTEESPTEVPSLSTTEDGTTDETETGTSGNPTSTLAIPPPATPFVSVGGVPTREGTGASPALVHQVAAALSKMHSSRRAKLTLPPECESSTCPATRSLYEHALAYYPNPVAAAKEVARAFAHSRGEVIDHRFHPIGATVLYTVDLVGFAHQEALLVWSLWARGATAPLRKSWLQHVIASEVEPQREDQTVPGRFWVPVPAQPGEYEVHLAVYTSNDVERGEMETEPFH
jgi:hypothetical protein